MDITILKCENLSLLEARSERGRVWLHANFTEMVVFRSNTEMDELRKFMDISDIDVVEEQL